MGNVSSKQQHQQSAADLREIQRLEMEASKKQLVKDQQRRAEEQVIIQKAAESKNAGWSGLFGGTGSQYSNQSMFPPGVQAPPPPQPQVHNQQRQRGQQQQQQAPQPLQGPSLADIQREERIVQEKQAAAA